MVWTLIRCGSLPYLGGLACFSDSGRTYSILPGETLRGQVSTRGNLKGNLKGSGLNQETLRGQVSTTDSFSFTFRNLKGSGLNHGQL